MNFYDDPDNVKKYIQMCEGYDGDNIYQWLGEVLPLKSSLLELGSGAGLDIEYLKKHYSVTGSDNSDEFLRVCREKHPEISFLKVSAEKLDVNGVYDCIYSNKVLHHLAKEILKESLKLQASLLKPNGLIAHSFWLGDESKEIEGLLFTYYTRAELLSVISQTFDIISTQSYKEFDEDDSLFVIARIRVGDRG